MMSQALYRLGRTRRPAPVGGDRRRGWSSPSSSSARPAPSAAQLEDSFRVPGLDSQQANDLLDRSRLRTRRA